jgi:hypothetical protein
MIQYSSRYAQVAKALSFVLICAGSILLSSHPSHANGNDTQAQPVENYRYGGIDFSPNRDDNAYVTPPPQPQTAKPLESNNPRNIGEPQNNNNWYGALDFGSNAIVVTNGSLTARSSSGWQATGKVGYSMSGPRIEIESSIGTLAGGAASFNGAAVNAYYDFQTGSVRPYVGVGYGFASVSAGSNSSSGSMVQSKLGISFESTPGNNFYVELRGASPTDSSNVGVGSINFGNTIRF